jgi:hypothetical protein
MTDFRKLSDDQLDDLFRAADAGSHIESHFDERFWNEMEDLLPSKQQPRRKLLIWWTAAAIVACLGFVAFWRNQERSNDWQVTPIAAKEKSTRKEGSIQAIPNEKVRQTAVSKTNGLRNTPLIHRRNSVNRLKDESSDANSNLALNLGDQQQILESQNENDSVEKLPFKKTEILGAERIIIPEKSLDKLFYWQLSTGIGQSYQSSLNHSAAIGYQAAIGIGVRKKVKQMEMSFGLQVRMESLPNIQLSSFVPYTTVSGAAVIAQKTTSMKQLFSIDFPIALGTWYQKHLFYGQLTPGYQQFYSGENRYYVNAIESSREKSTGKMTHAKTLTMELGVGYSYAIRRNFILGGQVNVDVIRPFDVNYYSGDQRHFPVNIQVTMRRFF